MATELELESVRSIILSRSSSLTHPAFSPMGNKSSFSRLKQPGLSSNYPCGKKKYLYINSPIDIHSSNTEIISVV
jgi:hypothetical protein